MIRNELSLSPVERRFLTAVASVSKPSITIEGGEIGDFRALSRFHYIAGEPATRVKVLRARSIEAETIGVLVVSMPTLDGIWRDLAWPGRYTSSDRKAAARRINTELRTLSRVIVDPRWRGLGIATRLVKAYLSDPLTPATEALAAMGSLCPFFRAAGMIEYPLPLRPADARLSDALQARHVHSTALCATARAHDLLDDPLLLREFKIWAKARKNTRVMTDSGQILWAAARALLARPRAYAHTHDPSAPV